MGLFANANDVPKLQRLMRTAFGIWFGGIGCYYAINESFQYKFRNSDFVKESMRVLNAYPHVENLLGENIKQLRFDLGDKFIRKNDQFGQIVIPVVGSKNKGKMYSWTSKQTKEDNTDQYYWRVDRADLMIHGHDPFTFFVRPEAEYVKDIKLEEKDLHREHN